MVSDSSPSLAESSFRELDDVFLQTQTRIWLGEVLETRLDEQLNISDLLADGELLFEVSKVVWKMLLTNCMEFKHLRAYKAVSSKKSSGRYRPYSNVDSFLKISKILGLAGIDLFSPSDVVEKRNTRKVCMCIRSLSKKARLKNLNVPDFDMVTYTIAMPTNMVGCIRRSLELSHCSFSSSDSYNQYKERKKNSVAAHARSYYSYSQESDDIESNYMGTQSHSRMNCASDSVNLDLENLPETSSVFKSYTSAQNELQLDIQNQENDEYTLDQYESQCLDESGGSHCSNCVEKVHRADIISLPSWDDSEINLRDRISCRNNRVRHGLQMDALDLIHVDIYLGNNASIVGDSTMKKSHVVHDLAINHGPDNSGLVLFDGDANIQKVEMSSDSCGSNSLGRTNGFGESHSDDIEDVEASSTSSVNSATSRVRHLDFNDQLDEDAFRAGKVLFPELQSEEADFVNGSLMGVCEYQDMSRYDKIIHGSTSDAENSYLDMEIEDIDFSTVLSSSFPDCQSYGNHGHGASSELVSSRGFCEEFFNHTPIEASNGSSQSKNINSVVDDEIVTITAAIMESDLQASCFNSGNEKLYDDSKASTGIQKCAESEKCNELSCKFPCITDKIAHQYESTPENHLCLKTSSSENICKRGQEVCTVLEKYIPCTENNAKSSSQEKRDEVDVAEAKIPDGKEDISIRIPQSKHQKRPLLKSVVTGTAVFGAMLVLLHLRRRSGRAKRGELSIKPTQIQKANGNFVQLSQRGEECKLGVVYPSDKLKFAD